MPMAKQLASNHVCIWEKQRTDITIHYINRLEYRLSSLLSLQSWNTPSSNAFSFSSLGFKACALNLITLNLIIFTWQTGYRLPLSPGTDSWLVHPAAGGDGGLGTECDRHGTSDAHPRGNSVCLAHLSAASHSPLLEWFPSHRLHTWVQTSYDNH